MVPCKGREEYTIFICANNVRNGPPNTDQGHSTASQGSCQVHGMSEYARLLPLAYILLAQNFYSKWIAPTDNMQPKSDDGLTIVCETQYQ